MLFGFVEVKLGGCGGKGGGGGGDDLEDEELLFGFDDFAVTTVLNLLGILGLFFNLACDDDDIIYYRIKI